MADNIKHSTGRGGAGNIGSEDNTATYLAGDIVREGPTEGSGSTGIGGAGNIAKPSQPPPTDSPAGVAGGKSEEIVPETATRNPGHDYDNYHTGRAGAGNVHKEKYGGHSHAQGESLLERAKHAVGLDKGEKKPET